MKYQKFIAAAFLLAALLSLIAFLSLSQGLEYEIKNISKDDWDRHPSEVEQEERESANNLSYWEKYNREKDAEVEIDQDKAKIRIKEFGPNSCHRYIHLRNYSLKQEVLTINTITHSYRDDLIERMKRKLPGRTINGCLDQIVYPEAELSIDLNQFKQRPNSLIVNGEKFSLN